MRPTLEAIHAYLSKQVYDSEVLIVDNGSTDKTKEVAREFQKNDPRIRILSENSHGKGWAVKQGMLQAKGDFRLFTDADNSTDISQLGTMLVAAQSGYDVVVSSRRLKESKIVHPQPWYREVLGNAFAALVRLIVPTGVHDTQNGFKLFSREAAEKIFPQQTIFYWAFDVEVIALARKFGFKIKEVPIVWVNNDKSGMSIKGMIRMLFEVIITRFHLLTREY